MNTSTSEQEDFNGETNPAGKVGLGRVQDLLKQAYGVDNRVRGTLLDLVFTEDATQDDVKALIEFGEKANLDNKKNWCSNLLKSMLLTMSAGDGKKEINPHIASWAKGLVLHSPEKCVKILADGLWLVSLDTKSGGVIGEDVQTLFKNLWNQACGACKKPRNRRKYVEGEAQEAGFLIENQMEYEGPIVGLAIVAKLINYQAGIPPKTAERILAYHQDLESPVLITKKDTEKETVRQDYDAFGVFLKKCVLGKSLSKDNSMRKLAKNARM